MPLQAQNLARCLPIIRAEIINVADLIITIIMVNTNGGPWASSGRHVTCLSPKMLPLSAWVACDAQFRWTKCLVQSQLTAQGQRLGVPPPPLTLQ